MANPFQKASRRNVRARIAFDGPSGSGKTWTSLEWARILGQKVAVVDTERASASLYSDRFDFDVLEIGPPFHPDRFTQAIRDAEAAGYDVLVIDSLSHVWEGEGGVLDIADAAGARAHGNSWAGWKAATPALRHLIDVILASDLHILVTMRSKTEWVLEERENKNGRSVQTPKRVGMAPVMRAGTEYEFTVIGDLDLEHRLTISKSRCDALADLVVQPGRAHEAAEIFLNWTKSGEELASRNDIDALKAQMNRIGAPEIRKAAKEAFVAQFGNPDYLVASKLEAARALVASYETATPAAEAAPADDGDRDPVNRAKRLAIAAHNSGIDEQMQDDLIGHITKGRTTSRKEVTEAEATELTDLYAGIRKNLVVVAYDPDGKVRLVEQPAS